MSQEMPVDIDGYIAAQLSEVQPRLRELRDTIKKAAPEAGERISWGMATFTLHGNLVHFSAQKKHMGFHPAPSAIELFREELAPYVCSKGTVQLPYDKPLPIDLITKMVRFRVKEQEAEAAARAAGVKAEPREKRPRCPMPEDVLHALEQEDLMERYEARPPYQRNDYLGWITRAKQPATREKRLSQMLEELRGGDSYMGQPYRAKQN